MKKAIVIGGTGMIGSELVKQLIDNVEYYVIISLVRRPSGVSHPKLVERIVDFDHPESWRNLITGDVLFSTLGTTLANAKSKEAQYKVDFTYQFVVAQIAATNLVPNYVLVSSAGANAESKSFYLNMKGKLDLAVQTLNFQCISIFRPGQLAGNRIEKRFGEKLALMLMRALNSIGMLKRYQPIHAQQLAKSMINAASLKKSKIYTLKEVFQIEK